MPRTVRIVYDQRAKAFVPVEATPSASGRAVDTLPVDAAATGAAKPMRVGNVNIMQPSAYKQRLAGAVQAAEGFKAAAQEDVGVLPSSRGEAVAAPATPKPPARVRVRIPRNTLAARNNNPGNLRYAGQEGARPGEGGFAAFDTVEQGYAALVKQIDRDASRGLTVGEFISKYAPPNENDTTAYTDFIRNATGHAPDDPLAAANRHKVALHVVRMEAGAKVDAGEEVREPETTQAFTLPEEHRPGTRIPTTPMPAESTSIDVTATPPSTRVRKEVPIRTTMPEGPRTGMAFEPGELQQQPALTAIDKLYDIKDNPQQLLPFVRSAPVARELADVSAAAYKIEAGTGSESDFKTIERFRVKGGKDTSFAYKVLDIASQTPAFATEIALTSGVYAAGRKAATSVGTAALKRLLGESAEAFAKRKSAALVGKVATGIAGATLQVPAAAGPSIATGTMERMLPDFQPVRDDAGKLVSMITLEGKKPIQAATEALADNWVEITSEYGGGVLKPAFKALPESVVNNVVVRALGKLNPAAKSETVRRIVESSAFHGPWGESFEERLGEVGRAVLGLEKYKLPSAEQVAAELVAFSIPGLATRMIPGGKPTDSGGGQLEATEPTPTPPLQVPPAKAAEPEVTRPAPAPVVAEQPTVGEPPVSAKAPPAPVPPTPSPALAKDLVAGFLPPGDFDVMGMPGERTLVSNEADDGVNVVVGRINGEERVQSVRFDPAKWTDVAAVTWLRDNAERIGRPDLRQIDMSALTPPEATKPIAAAPVPTTPVPERPAPLPAVAAPTIPGARVVAPAVHMTGGTFNVEVDADGAWWKVRTRNSKQGKRGEKLPYTEAAWMKYKSRVGAGRAAAATRAADTIKVREDQLGPALGIVFNSGIYESEGGGNYRVSGELRDLLGGIRLVSKDRRTGPSGFSPLDYVKREENRQKQAAKGKHVPPPDPRRLISTDDVLERYNELTGSNIQMWDDFLRVLESEVDTLWGRGAAAGSAASVEEDEERAALGGVTRAELDERLDAEMSDFGVPDDVRQQIADTGYDDKAYESAIAPYEDAKVAERIADLEAGNATLEELLADADSNEAFHARYAEGLRKVAEAYRHVPTPTAPAAETSVRIGGVRRPVQSTTALVDVTDLRGTVVPAGSPVYITTDTTTPQYISPDLYTQLTTGAPTAEMFGEGEVERVQPPAPSTAPRPATPGTPVQAEVDRVLADIRNTGNATLSNGVSYRLITPVDAHDVFSIEKRTSGGIQTVRDDARGLAMFKNESAARNWIRNDAMTEINNMAEGRDQAELPLQTPSDTADIFTEAAPPTPVAAPPTPVAMTPPPVQAPDQALPEAARFSSEPVEEGGRTYYRIVDNKVGITVDIAASSASAAEKVEAQNRTAATIAGTKISGYDSSINHLPWYMSRTHFNYTRAVPVYDRITRFLRSGGTFNIPTNERTIVINTPDKIRLGKDGLFMIQEGKNWVSLPNTYNDMLAAQAGYPVPRREDTPTHRDYVEAALAAGEDVPDTVLADYPDLLEQRTATDRDTYVAAGMAWDSMSKPQRVNLIRSTFNDRYVRPDGTTLTPAGVRAVLATWESVPTEDRDILTPLLTGGGGGGAAAPIAQFSEVPPTPARVVSAAGLSVTQSTSKAGNPYWVVRGNLDQHKSILDKLGFKPYNATTGGRAVFTDPTATLAKALSGGPITPPDAPRASGTLRTGMPELPLVRSIAAIKDAGLVVMRTREGWRISGNTYDVRDALKSIGARFVRNEGGKPYYELTGDADPTTRLGRAVDDALQNERRRNESSTERVAAGALRGRLDAEPDKRGTAADIEAAVQPATKELIRRGLNAGVNPIVVDQQIGDIGHIVRCYTRGGRMFLLAEPPGSGKTFVLGGAIRALHANGAHKFVYFTQNRELIGQIQDDLRDYGLPPIDFHTYDELKDAGASRNIDVADAVLILDESHTVKNIEGATRAREAAPLMEAARMTILSSASPYENPVDAEYLAPTGIFESAGGFEPWAFAFGATPVRVPYKGRNGVWRTKTVPEWRGKGHEADAKAAREWLSKQGVFVQHPPRINPALADITFRKLLVEQRYVDLYDSVVDAYASAIAANGDVFGSSIDRSTSSQMAMHRENMLKRILEAAKLPEAIAAAKRSVADGRRVVIFTETKKDRYIGRWQRFNSNGVGDTKWYTYAEMVPLMEDWYDARAMAKRAQMMGADVEVPPPPFAEFIYQLAAVFDAAGIDYSLPSTLDAICEACGDDDVAIYTGAYTLDRGRRVTESTAHNDLEHWRRGGDDDPRILVASMAKGGTGLSLHDKVGTHPTTQINLNVPWKAPLVEQVQTRVAREGMKSKVLVEWLFSSNIPWESDRLAPRVAQRLRDMGAVVKGQDSVAADYLESWDFEGSVDIGEFGGQIAQFADVKRTVPVKFDVDAELIIPTFYKDVISEDPPGTIMGELFQNGVDALRGRLGYGPKVVQRDLFGEPTGGLRGPHPAINIYIDASVDAPDTPYNGLTVVAFEDNGEGLTPEEVNELYVKVGARGKDSAVSSGGYGRAKVSYLLFPDAVELVTVKNGERSVWYATRDQIMHGNAPDVQVYAAEGEPTGTRLTMTLPAGHSTYAFRQNAEHFANTLRIPGITVTIYDRINPRTQYSGQDVMHRVDSPGFGNIDNVLPPRHYTLNDNAVDIYYERASDTMAEPTYGIGGRPAYIPRITIYNKGIPVGVRKWSYQPAGVRYRPDFCVHVNFRETPDVVSESYPFLENRKELTKAQAARIESIITDDLREWEHSLIAAENLLTAAVVNEGDWVGGMRVLNPFVDEERAAASDVLQSYPDLMSDLGRALDQFRAMMDEIGEPECEYALAVDPSVFGTHIDPVVTGNHILALNPFAADESATDSAEFANWIAHGGDPNVLRGRITVWTIIHEQAHIRVPDADHGQEFWREVFRLVVAIGSHKQAQLEDAFNDIYTKHDVGIGIIRDRISTLGAAGNRLRPDRAMLSETLRITRRAGVRGGAQSFGTAGGGEARVAGQPGREQGGVAKPSSGIPTGRLAQYSRKPSGESGHISIGRGPRNPYRFATPTVQSEYDASRGIPRVPLLDKVTGLLHTLGNRVTREYEHLPKTGEFARLRFKLLQLEKARGIAMEVVGRRLYTQLDVLSDDDYYRFNVKVVLDDLVATLKADPNAELPWSLTPETLATEHARITEEVSSNKFIQDALADRKAMWQDARKEYVQAMADVGFNVDKRMRREDYYRHQVLEYANARQIFGPGNRLHVPTGRGHLKARKGSTLNINADYLQAETEVLATMWVDSRIAETLKLVSSTAYNIADRVKAAAKAEGRQYHDLNDIKDLAPAGYVIWQPREGNVFFLAYSIPERVALAIMEADMSDPDADIPVKADDIRTILAMGGKRRQLIIKEEVAATLNNLMRRRSDNFLFKADRAITRYFKMWSLISPTRYAKYNIRNLTGDADGVFVGNPRVFKKVPEAIRDLLAAYTSHTPLTGNMAAWVTRGGNIGTMQAQEIDAVNELYNFTSRYDRRTAAFGRAWSLYWRTARISTDFRESILRYSAFLQYLDEIQAGSGKPLSYGASLRHEIDALRNPHDKAFWLSNDLLGAYDRVGVMGRALREYNFPFWSWKEVNFIRYQRLLRNAVADGRAAGTLARTLPGVAVRGTFAAVRVAKFVLMAAAFTAAVKAWNMLRFPDEERELPAYVRQQPHVVLGRGESGEIYYFTRPGALGDLLSWFGLEASPFYASELAHGRMSVKDVAYDMFVKSPVNQVVQGLWPVQKTIVEIALQRSLYPDAFRPGPVRDRAQYLAQTLGLRNEFDAIMNRPNRGYVKNLPTELFAYRVDPGEAAYNDLYSLRMRYLQSIGKGGRGFWMDEKSNALYNTRLALRYGDNAAADAYAKKYFMLGGTARGLGQSLKAMHPFYGLDPAEAAGFLVWAAGDTGEGTRETVDKAARALAFYVDMVTMRVNDPLGK